jgi:mRNA interferase MazF
MKHESTIHCDELVSLSKTSLTDWIGSLAGLRLGQLDRALQLALDLR